MAKSKKTGANTRRNAANGSDSGSNRIFDDVLALAGTLARGRKESGAEKLQMIAESTRDFGDSITEMPNLSRQIASAADSLDGLAEYVMDSDLEQMLQDAKTFARRHPMATLAITVAGGLVASRYLVPWQSLTGNTAQNRRPAGRKRENSSSYTPASDAPSAANGRAHSDA